MWDRQSAFLEWLVQICDKTTIPIPAASFDSQQPAVMLVHILRAWYNHVMHRGRGPYNIIMSISRFLLYSSCQKQKIRVTAFIILPQLTVEKTQNENTFYEEIYILWGLREGFTKKKLLFFWILSKLPPPNLDNLYNFFERQKRRFRRHSKWHIIKNSNNWPKRGEYSFDGHNLLTVPPLPPPPPLGS